MKHLILQIYLLFIAFFLPYLGKGQSTGINFEKVLSWKEIKAKAEKENKPIFLDCYASWCAPCKLMDQKIYPDKEVGEYFNLHFINIRVQMDRTPKDAPEIQSWYHDADSIAKRFGIDAFPTFLFLSPEGQPIHEVIGASATATEFIAHAEKAFDPESEYFTLLGGWPSHKEDSAYLLHALLAIKMAKDDGQAHAIANYYIGSLKSPIQKNTIELISSFITSESDESFQFYLKNAGKINEMEGNSAYVENRLSAIILKEEVSPLLSDKERAIDFNEVSADMISKYRTFSKELFAKDLDELFQQAISRAINELANGKDLDLKAWAVISQKVQKRFPGYDCGRIMLGTEARYFYGKHAWNECAEAAISLIDQYNKVLDANTINTYIWRCIFVHGQDMNILRRALVHMKNVIKATPEDIDNLDTYANLLYKMGLQQEAIRWENKAIEIADKKKGGDSELEDTLKKMKNGEITWGDAAKG